MSGIQYNSSEELLDLGTCPKYGKKYECYSLQANKLICAENLMFGDCKGHDVITIEEAGQLIRNKIDEAGKDGILKYEVSENILLDIRHTKILCEEKKQKILRETDEVFSQTIKNLKARKQAVLEEIENHFNSQIESLYEQEQKWNKKQEDAKEIVNLARAQSDLQILSKSKDIIDTLDSLRQPLEYKNLQLINTLNSNLHFNKIEIPLKELQKCIDSFVQAGEQINIQYKC